MQISSLLSKYLDTSPTSKRPETIQPADNAQPTDTPASSSSAATARTLRDILSQYDITNISPRGFSEMLQSLRKAGAIDEQQFRDLSAIRGELDQAGIDPNEPTNLLRFYAEKVDEAQTAGEKANSPDAQTLIADMQRRLEWLKKLTTVQTATQSVGLDSLA
jgi:hypothetical protein